MATQQELESMVVRLTGEASSYRAMLAQAQQQTRVAADQIGGHAARVQNFGTGLSRYALGAMGAMGPLVGVIGAVGSAFKGVQLFAQAEDAQTSFKVLLGSAAAAKNRFEELAKFAAETPFEMPEVLAASKQLQTAGGTMLATGDSLRMVGDMAATAGVSFQEVALHVGRMYGAMQSGRPFGESAMRLAELALLSGDARNRLEQMQKAGASGKDIWAAFSKEMEKFKGMMAERSQTLTGLFSTMKDDINSALRTIGEDISKLFMLKDIMRGISEAAQNVGTTLKEMHPALKAAVAAGLSFIGVVAVLELMWQMALIIGPSMANLKMVLATVLGPVGLLTVAVAALAALWVNWNGGISNSLQIIRGWLEDVWDSVQSGGMEAIAMIRQWAADNRRLVQTVAAIAIAVAAGIVVWKLAALAIMLVTAAATLLHLKQLAGIIIWAAWSAAVLVAKGAMLLWAAGTLVVKAAVWLLNAGLSVLGVLLAGIPILVAAVVAALVGGLLALALVPIAAAAWGVWKAFNAVMDALESLPTGAGPIKAISDMFGEWGSVLKNVFSMLRRDSQAAFAILSAGANLAISQIKDVWRPLMDFLSESLEAVWDLAAFQFENQFLLATAKVALEMTKLNPFADDEKIAEMEKQMEDMARVAEIGERAALRMTKERLDLAVQLFNLSNKESKETKQRRQNLHNVQNVEEARVTAQEGADAIQEMLAKGAGKAAQAGANLGKEMNKGVKGELGKLDAAQIFSAEAFSRIAAYQDAILTAKRGADKQRPGGGGVPDGARGAEVANRFEPHQMPGVFNPANDREVAQTNLLREIRDALKGKEVLTIEDSDIA